MDGTRRVGRGWVVAAIAWTALYVASKVAYAVEGRLGVTGGPEVGPADYAAYGPGGVEAAQWGNVAVGVLGMTALAVSLLPAARRLPRLLLVLPLGAFGLMALGGGVVMIVRALGTDRGGVVFGLYSLVWAGLITMAAVRQWSSGQRRPAHTP